jgi:acetyltransferase
MNPSPLRSLIEPASIAIIGVSHKSDGVGRRVLRNVRQGGFEGPVYAVNPRGGEVEGQALLSSLEALPEAVDLAIVAVPAASVLEVVRACAARGVRNAIVLSAGFAEMGAEGAARQAELVREARARGVRILGPNCLGLMRAPIALNASFSGGIAVSGKLALVSQSGAVCSAILDWAEQRQIGFSTVVSLGAAADVGVGEVLDCLALDAATDAILLYVEGVDHARAFVSGLRAAAQHKPVIVVKAGRRTAGHRAAVSHTGAVVGDDAVFDAALRRTGAVRVATLHELFSAADVLCHAPLARGESTGDHHERRRAGGSRGRPRRRPRPEARSLEPGNPSRARRDPSSARGARQPGRRARRRCAAALSRRAQAVSVGRRRGRRVGLAHAAGDDGARGRRASRCCDRSRCR